LLPLFSVNQIDPSGAASWTGDHGEFVDALQAAISSAKETMMTK